MAKGDLPRQTVVRPVGLVTQPNEFGYYVDGALEHAINCVMRNPGELDAAPSMYSSQATANANDTVHKLMPLDNGHTYALSASAGGVWSVQEAGTGATLPVFASTTGLFSSTGRISPARAKDRMLLNSNNGILVGDNMQPSNATERALRLAGLPQLSIIDLTFVTSATSNDGAISQDSAVSLVFGWCAIQTRTYADGYFLASVPTPVIKRTLAAGTLSITYSIKVTWAATDVMAVGDVIELYRTSGLGFPSLIQSSRAEPPPEMFLVVSHTITAADIAAGSYTFSDTSKMGATPYFQTTGRALYSNPNQGGATTINRQPPVSNCVASFDGRTFYGNTTDRPKMSVKIPAGTGYTTAPECGNPYWRANGIGARNISAGTRTNGSPTWTGIPTADLLGVVPGQRCYGGGFLLTAVVQSVNAGAGTVTFTTPDNASGSAAGFIFCDVIYIGFNGGTLFPYRFADLGDLYLNLGGAGVAGTPGNLFEITSNQAPYAGNFNNTLLSINYYPNLALTIEPRNYGTAVTTMQVTATNGANYSPALAEFGTTPTSFARTQLKNFLICSKDQQPEHVPPGLATPNSFFIGLREIIAMVSTEAAMWIACLDGIFRLSGFGGQYRVDPIDSTKIICGPQCMTSMDEDVYIYTNYGMFEMDSQNRNNLTDTIIGDLLPGPEYLETATRILVANENDLEILYRDTSSANRLWVYMTREGGGWTTLENNGAALSNITALAYQRSPFSGSGDPRVLVGVSPLGGSVPSYAGWGFAGPWLTMDFQYQPFYAGDPMTLKQFIEASFMWNATNTGKSLRPMWNSTPVGAANIVQYQNAAYARAGVPRVHATSQSISVGCDSVTNTGVQPRFLGVSLAYLPLTTQAKQRGT